MSKRSLGPHGVATHGTAATKRCRHDTIRIGPVIAVIADTHMPKGAVIFGHSHLPLHEEEDGFQIFNPGSPTERRRAPQPSMGLLTYGKTGLDFEHLWL